MLQNNKLPSASAPITDPGGAIQPAWMQFFTQLVSQPASIVSVAPAASPFAYTASQKGMLSIKGGTVSGITLTRSRVTVALAQTSGLIPMAQGDALTITYSAAPSINFIPG